MFDTFQQPVNIKRKSDLSFGFGSDDIFSNNIFEEKKTLNSVFVQTVTSQKENIFNQQTFVNQNKKDSVFAVKKDIEREKEVAQAPKTSDVNNSATSKPELKNVSQKSEVEKTQDMAKLMFNVVKTTALYRNTKEGAYFFA